MGNSEIPTSCMSSKRSAFELHGQIDNLTTTKDRGSAMIPNPSTEARFSSLKAVSVRCIWAPLGHLEFCRETMLVDTNHEMAASNMFDKLDIRVSVTAR